MNAGNLIVERSATLKEHLMQGVLGQERAIDRACSVLQRGACGLASKDRPLGSLLLIGPTGVGKTEFTKRFTAYLFEGKNRLVRLDMSEYQNKEQLEVLLGDGSNPQGQLGRFFDLNRDAQGELRGGTILLDEIEKAHPDILLILLQVLEEGRLTLRDGTLLDLSEFFVVMTSNIGASEAMEMRKSSQETIDRVLFSLVKERLRPELVGRISEVVVFSRLEYAAQIEIARLLLDREMKRLKGELGYSVSYDDSALELAIVEGFDSRFGARPLRRCIERLVGDAIVEKLFLKEEPNGKLFAKADTGRLVLSDE